MKNLKASVAMLALVFGLGSAFATTLRKDPTDRKWARDSDTGLYSDITGQTKGVDYDCQDASSICTATYPVNQDPNVNPSGALSQEDGLFQ